jgi:phosphoglycerol transferase MdoB-like AlkP superfamily enzyme
MDKLRALLLTGPGRSRRPVDLGATAAFALGGALLVWSAFIHFHLWSEVDGYRSIPTIGPLFLLQSITALIIGIGVVAFRRLWAAVIGIGFALTTIAGFLLSVAVGLFGFKDSWLAPYAKQAFTIEILAVVVLMAAAALCLVGSVPRARAGTTPAGTAT